MKILPIPNKPVADRDDPEGFLLPPHDRASVLEPPLTDGLTQPGRDKDLYLGFRIAPGTSS